MHDGPSAKWKIDIQMSLTGVTILEVEVIYGEASISPLLTAVNLMYIKQHFTVI